MIQRSPGSLKPQRKSASRGLEGGPVITHAYTRRTSKEPAVSVESEKDTINIPSGDPSRIFIIHGRNTTILAQLRIWLESLGLHAKGFDELRAELGGSPTILEVIKKGMTEARGIIALMTPDEVAFLRTDLHREHDSASDKERWQARPNVIFEAGMAFALAGESAP